MKTPNSILQPAKTYSQLLADPRWRERRKRYYRDNQPFCKSCRQVNDEKELHLHHLAYESGRAPWDYDDNELICLCKTCHELWHNSLKFWRLKVIVGMSAPEQQALVAALYALVRTKGPTATTQAILGLAKNRILFTTARVSGERE